MVKFGPSGADELFQEAYGGDFEKMPEWLNKQMGLNACEYAFNLGIRVSDAKAIKIGENAKAFGVEVTAHAPYYINFANPSEDFEYKNNAYIISSLKKLKLMGGRRLTVHLGTQGKGNRQDCLKLIKERLIGLKKMLDDNQLFDCLICFETMGKYSQIGTFEELAPLTNIDDRYNLTLDFGHINCTMQGALKEEKDYEQIFEHLFKVMPKEKVKNVHIHFSKILYNSKGEIKHSTFDEFNEPPFEPLAKVLKKYDINSVIICESRGTQARDALKMKKIFEKTL